MKHHDVHCYWLWVNCHYDVIIGDCHISDITLTLNLRMCQFHLTITSTISYMKAMLLKFSEFSTVVDYDVLWMSLIIDYDVNLDHWLGLSSVKWPFGGSQSDPQRVPQTTPGGASIPKGGSKRKKQVPSENLRPLEFHRGNHGIGYIHMVYMDDTIIYYYDIYIYII